MYGWGFDGSFLFDFLLVFPSAFHLGRMQSELEVVISGNTYGFCITRFICSSDCILFAN